MLNLLPMTQPPISSDQASSSAPIPGVPAPPTRSNGVHPLVPPPIIGSGDSQRRSTPVSPAPVSKEPSETHAAQSERWKGQDELPPPLPSSRPKRGLPATLEPQCGALAEHAGTSLITRGLPAVTSDAMPDGSVLGEHQPTDVHTHRWTALPSWLVSLIVHTLVLVCLVLIPLSVKRSGTSVLSISIADNSQEDSVMFETLPELNQPTEDEAIQDQPAPVDAIQTSKQPPISVTTSLFPQSPPDTAGPLLASMLAESSGAQSLQELPTGGMYRRDADSRKQLGKMYGATEESEDAVEAALAWLAAHQQRNGSWSFDLSNEPCNGRCRNNQRDGADNARPATAATGLALLAFLGAGYSQHEGKYAETVQRGLYFLRDAAMPTDFGSDLQSGSMYGHGIAALAISEAMAMSRYNGRQDRELLGLTTDVANFTMTAQHQLGGWRYVPGSPGDMTVSAWQILSLVSAQHGGVILRTDTLSRAETFIRSLSKPEMYQFGYQSQRAEPRTTAIGLCLLLYLGQSPKEAPFAMSIDALAARGPRLTDVYHDYYATLVLHHVRHREWAAWHVPLRDHLIKTQSKLEHEAGSWHFKDENGDVGGRLYTTAMAAMILEVYYRYLPLYQDRGEFRLH